jgi:thiamine-phosphate pyrophosphorylase
MLEISKLNGLYVITDDILTPDETIFLQVEKSLKGGAKIVQLRDKINSDLVITQKAISLQALCKKYNALFVLNDKIDIAIKINCDGLHIGKSDHHRFEEIRENFQGIIGVSCYSDIKLAKQFEEKGASYVAFGSFFTSPTKPNSNIIELQILTQSKGQLNIPICAIGGINTNNVDAITYHKPDMISLISDIWSSNNIEEQAKFFANKF